MTTITEARLQLPIRSIQEIYRLLPESAHIVHSCSTGYGEALLKAALMLDDGEVETVAITMPPLSLIQS